MEKPLTDEELVAAKARRLVAAHLQAIEDNPPNAEQTAMFEMFEREGWDDDRCRAYILARKPAALVR